MTIHLAAPLPVKRRPEMASFMNDVAFVHFPRCFSQLLLYWTLTIISKACIIEMYYAPVLNAIILIAVAQVIVSILLNLPFFWCEGYYQ
jgi:hypothetical protein